MTHRYAAPLSSHLANLRRDGVTRDGALGRMFDAEGDDVGTEAFADRCVGDRLHFRFIVAPEDADELADLKGYTRDLMRTAVADLGTRLDRVALDHWNTGRPHVHMLLRGRIGASEDLDIARNYFGHSLRARAAERATLELGPRNNPEIARAVAQEVDDDRWTGLDSQLQRDAIEGIVDLRPRFGAEQDRESGLRIGRACHLEPLGLAEPTVPGHWRIADGAEPRLRTLQRRGDIITRLRIKDGACSLSDLVRSALRLRPDRIPIGEVRGPDALACSRRDRPSGRDRHDPRGLRPRRAAPPRAADPRGRRDCLPGPDRRDDRPPRGPHRRLVELVSVNGLTSERDYAHVPVTPDSGAAP